MNAWQRLRVYTWYMARNRTLAGQQYFFPASVDPGEVTASLRTWSDDELLALARQVGYELIRRGRPVPIALPVGEAVASLSSGIAAVTVPA